MVTGAPIRADLFGPPVFLSSQGEISVLARRTTRELIEATCRFLATSREFGATSTNYPGGARGPGTRHVNQAGALRILPDRAPLNQATYLHRRDCSSLMLRVRLSQAYSGSNAAIVARRRWQPRLPSSTRAGRRLGPHGARFTTGLRGYGQTPGNLGAQMWTTDLGDGRTEVMTFSWWSSRADIERLPATTSTSPCSTRGRQLPHRPRDHRHPLRRRADLDIVSLPFPEPVIPVSSRAEVFVGYLDCFRSRLVSKLEALPGRELRRSRLDRVLFHLL